MLTSAPYPPKDYILKKATNLQVSSSQFTPNALPRVTQTNLGLYCFPIEYDETKGESPANIQKEPVHRSVLNNWVMNSRAFWVTKPGLDDNFTHDIFRRYSVEPENIRFKNKEKVFNRSYNYELTCLDETRLEKLRKKCKKEELEREKRLQHHENREHLKKHRPLTVQDCRKQPPFWWKATDVDQKSVDVKIETEQKTMPVEEMIVDDDDSGRWAERPSLTGVGRDDDPCKRREDMRMVGQLFKHEACMFYYNNYPPPKIAFRPKRFI